MAWGSTVPAVKAALTALWDAAVDGVTVSNGLPVSSSTALDSVVVGYSSQAEPTAATGRDEVADYGGHRDQEIYTVQCRIVGGTALTDPVAAETRLFDLLAELGGVLAGNRSLSGLVMQAQIGQWALTQEQTPQGATATLIFGVDIAAFTTI